jgi:hypothetical protein
MLAIYEEKTVESSWSSWPKSFLDSEGKRKRRATDWLECAGIGDLCDSCDFKKLGPLLFWTFGAVVPVLCVEGDVLDDEN